MKQNESLAETRAVFVLFAQKPNKTEQSPEYGFFCGGFYGRINENSKNAEGGPQHDQHAENRISHP